MNDQATSARISVCLASYNGERYLCEQVNSILRQLAPGDELLVSDDASTDATLSVLESYGDRLRVVGRDRAGGVVKNFERVLAAANGDFIVLSDQDDVWLDGRLDLVRERLQAVSLLMMNGIVVDGALSPTGQDVLDFVGFRSGVLHTLAHNGFVGCCMAFRRELLDAALPFPPRILWHDWYIALLGQLLYTVECSEGRTILFRRHGANFSATGRRSPRSLWAKLASRGWMMRALAIAVLRQRRRRAAGDRR